VIAYGRGGALESVVEGRTGLFFPEQTADSLISAVQRFEAMEWDASLIRRNAERFSAERFRGEFRNFVESEWAATGHRLADSASADWLAADATASAPPAPVPSPVQPRMGPPRMPKSLDGRVAAGAKPSPRARRRVSCACIERLRRDTDRDGVRLGQRPVTSGSA